MIVFILAEAKLQLIISHTQASQMLVLPSLCKLSSSLRIMERKYNSFSLVVLECQLQNHPGYLFLHLLLAFDSRAKFTAIVCLLSQLFKSCYNLLWPIRWGRLIGRDSSFRYVQAFEEWLDSVSRRAYVGWIWLYLLMYWMTSEWFSSSEASLWDLVASLGVRIEAEEQRHTKHLFFFCLYY